jgi:digeranylgeranylglycerophospholipid reductase
LRTEAVVVGAGPAGLIAAREMARSGVTVRVLEEHEWIGEPNHCAGVLSVEGLQRLGVEPSNDFIQHEVRGGRAYSPDGQEIRITGSRTRAYVVDRAAFDRHLARLASDEGAEVETGSRVTELKQKKGRVVGVATPRGVVECEVVIDAEGIGGRLARSLGLPRPSKGILKGVNVEVAGVELEPHNVEVWTGEDLAPGLFAWVIPLPNGGARCGLACSEGDPVSRLNHFLSRRFGEVERSKPITWPVNTGGAVERTYGDGILLVGDVAGQAKPTTGGGVVIGGLCALEAAATAVEALQIGYSSSASLRLYEGLWRRKYGRELSSMLAARRFVNRLSDGRLNRMFDAVRGAGLEGALVELVEEGDMDLQSGVMMSALGHPGLLRALVSTAGRVALAELRGLFNL